MGEGNSTAAIRCLEPSISFGRFENDLLSWEKWSAFSQNKYLEEVEKCATPGSVKEKKAFFEARNMLIAARKADFLNKQMESFPDSSKENEVQDTRGSEANCYDEEVIDENVFGSELSSPDMDDHPELEVKTNLFAPQSLSEDDVSKDISTNHFTTDKVTKETIFTSEARFPPIIESNENFTVFGPKSQMHKYSPNENASKGALVIDKADSQNATKEDQEEPILESGLSGCGTDPASNMQTDVIGSAQTVGGSENVKSEVTKEIPASETEKTALVPECDRRPLNSSDKKSAQTQKMLIKSQKSSKKMLSVNKQSGVELVKKTQVSSDSRSSQKSTPKISKPSSPTANSLSRVKKTAASALPKSPHLLNNVRPLPRATTPPVKSTLPRATTPPVKSTLPRATTPPVKSTFLLSSNKGHDSLPLKKKSVSAGVSRKSTPTSLHMSLNYGSKDSGLASGSASVTEPRKSLFMEKMGDKDIVKRAFRAFRNMSIPLDSVSHDMNATLKQIVKNKTDVKLSTPVLRRDTERFVKKDINEKGKKPSSISKSYNLAVHSKEDKRKEEDMATETRARVRRQSLADRASTQPVFPKGQRLTKSFQAKDASKSELRK